MANSAQLHHRTYISLPLTDEHYHAIGHVAAMWAALEAQFHWITWRLMGVPMDVGRLTTASLRLETLQTIIPILAEMRGVSKAENDDIAVLIRKAKALAEKRHTVIHTQWNFGSEEGKAKTYSFKLQSKPEEFTAKAIENLALEINALLRPAFDLSNALLQASQGKPLLPRRKV